MFYFLWFYILTAFVIGVYGTVNKYRIFAYAINLSMEIHPDLKYYNYSQKNLIKFLSFITIVIILPLVLAIHVAAGMLWPLFVLQAATYANDTKFDVLMARLCDTHFVDFSIVRHAGIALVAKRIEKDC